MPDSDSIGAVAYRSLDFLGYPDYRVGDDGSVWTQRRRSGGSPKLAIGDAEEIRQRYRAGACSQRQLAEEYGCHASAVGDIARAETWQPKQAWRRLSLSRHPKKGHLLAELRNDAGRKAFWVHRLVLMAFVGPCPPGMEGCHFPDRSPQNNRLENLRWDTKAANEADKEIHGTITRGEQHGAAKLTEADVREIRRLYSPRVCSFKKLGRMFGVDFSTVYAIVKRKSWRHID